MRTLAATALAAMLLAGCAAGAGGPRERFYRSLAPQANPSAVIATELAFARTAREKGLWAAFREYGADDAVLVRPEGVVRLKEWLRGAGDPPDAGSWQPHSVWMSCDGTAAVTRGAYAAASGKHGRFASVWRRERNDKYRFIFTFGSALDTGLATPEMIAATVADCDSQFEALGVVNSEEIESGEGASKDATLAWHYGLHEDGKRTFDAWILREGRMVEVVSDVNDPGETDPE